ncbi:hypothetical protein [Mycoplasma sp. 1018B]|uniref:hypothetical protein n=1 Tax=Mycoplasma sp. 1018B TaxID=2967302 RepID=UPI00211CE8B8|nr:hypothetical protein [Mycoplasma sp. 1018B]UUM19126.1 hypothetical protein NPA14_02205 [Mycoplasma sp. 1018B]
MKIWKFVIGALLVSSISVTTAITAICTTTNNDKTVAKENENKYANRNVGEIDTKWNIPKYADYTNLEIKDSWNWYETDKKKKLF